MKTKRVNRYYCDHCKKSGCSAYHIRVHEASCTANPERVCRMCEFKSPLSAMISILRQPGTTTADWKQKMIAVREEAENCPACILAAIRQSGVQQDLRLENLNFDSPSVEGQDPRWFPGPTGGQDHCLGFDFRSEKKDYMNEKNERRYGGQY